MNSEISKAIFFVAASPKVGAGHVMRCRALAAAIGEPGAVAFALAGDSGYWGGVLAKDGFQLIAQDAIGRSRRPAVIMDGYEFDEDCHRLCREAASCLMVMDDRGYGSPAADIILNQNAGYTDLEYRGKISSHARLLLGPSYALLRKEFEELRKGGVSRDCSRVRRVLVSMGGSDTRNATMFVVEALERLDCQGGLDVTLILGPHNRRAQEITDSCRSLRHRYRVERNAQQMEQFMLEADWALGLVGVAMWERMCLGLPTVLLALDEHQDRIAASLGLQKAALYAGRCDRMAPGEIGSLTADFIADAGLRAQLSKNCFNLVDGAGAGRVARILNEVINGVSKCYSSST